MGFIQDMMLGNTSMNESVRFDADDYVTEADLQAALEFMGDDDDFGEENAYDFEEAMLYAAQDSADNFNSIMEAMMIQEFQTYLNTGEEMVYEAVNVKGVFGKIKAGVKKAWEKIKQVFKKVVTYLSGKVKTDAAFIRKHEAYLKKCDGKSIANFTGYKFDNLKNISMYSKGADIVTGEMKEAEKKRQTKISKTFKNTGVLSKGYNDEEKYKADNSDKELSTSSKWSKKDVAYMDTVSYGDSRINAKGGMDVTDDMTKTDKQMWNALSKVADGKKIESQEDWTNAVKKFFGVLDTVSITKFNAPEVISEIGDAKMSKDAAKLAFNAAKKTIQSYLATIEANEKCVVRDLGKFDAKGKKSSDSISKYVAYQNYLSAFGIKCLNTIYHYHIKAINKANSQARKLANYAIANDLAGSKKAASESTIGGFFDDPDAGLV